mgnify:CR=1 FL=1
MISASIEPQVSERLQFVKVGGRWHLGNRPTRVRSEIAENDNGEVTVTEFGPDGAVAEVTVLRGRAA